MITTQLELCSLQSAQVDHLGRLLAEIADLQKQAEEIKDSIKDLARTGVGLSRVKCSLEIVCMLMLLMTLVQRILV